MTETPNLSEVLLAQASEEGKWPVGHPAANSLTLKEKTSYATRRAIEDEAEKHFYDKAQPFLSLGFSVEHRNAGHWDVYARQCPGKASAWRHANPGGLTSARDGGQERAFRIRGEPGNVLVFDERWDPHRPHPRGDLKFKSVMAAMVWIAGELMQEPSGRTAPSEGN